jgi:hypothetical protein
VTRPGERRVDERLPNSVCAHTPGRNGWVRILCQQREPAVVNGSTVLPRDGDRYRQPRILDILPVQPSLHAMSCSPSRPQCPEPVAGLDDAGPAHAGNGIAVKSQFRETRHPCARRPPYGTHSRLISSFRTEAERSDRCRCDATSVQRPRQRAADDGQTPPPSSYVRSRSARIRVGRSSPRGQPAEPRW